VIGVTVRLKEGALSHLRMAGHASPAAGPRGGNIVCAATTAVVRSCVEAIAARPDVVVAARGDEGELSVTVTGYPPDVAEWLRGVTEVLLVGVRRIADDSPDEISLTVEDEGVRNGS
jgi:uncharacterized protein YsxB (DUF464 family)